MSKQKDTHSKEVQELLQQISQLDSQCYDELKQLCAFLHVNHIKDAYRVSKDEAQEILGELQKLVDARSDLSKKLIKHSMKDSNFFRY